jgi:hypothetical protein
LQTTSFSLGEMLRRVKEQGLTIPQFQRSFIWKEAQVKLLVDSLSRSYPIGSLLLLAKKPNLPLFSRSIEAVLREGFPPDDLLTASEPPAAESFYILDGQQRTTSIARVFLNAHPRKTYYFDLKKMISVFKDEETSWVATRARGENDPDRKERGRLLRSDIILDQRKADVYVSEYVEDSGDFPEFTNNRSEARNAAAFIKGVFESIRNYQIPIVILDRDAGVESVCRVFETINSTGTRLTTFDLAVARFFPQPDLRKLWSESQETYPILQDFEVDGERVLQVLLLMRAGRDNRYAEPARNDLLSLPKTAIEQDWGLASLALSNAYQWARAQGARPKTLPNHGVIVAIAGYQGLANLQNTKPLDGEEAVLRRWYFCKVLQAGARQAANYKIGQDFSSLIKYRRDGVPPPFEDVRLSIGSVVRLRPADVRYKVLQNLMATTIRQDLSTGRILNSESKLHDHHIFPKAAHKKHGLASEKLDSVANRIPVLEETNLSLGEAYPEKYMISMRNIASSNGTLDELSRRMEDCLIPGNLAAADWASTLVIDKFEEFCRDRAELILRRVKQVVGDSIVIGDPTADDEAEEDDLAV